ncbi:hypothetical protein TWF569_000745 [Orbilia oligospora]|uniref:Uncharacterized protein n=1 Tax=Orbilia oligospora TaxID=2813651 RepID=A0A7C8JBY2_ORBOL|nr:hypothetical protein TWF706_011696 [Orbilia oligospora]KAF3099549.1 hypothetical protein TWF102_005518 [Orbilia oligospora]KAF3103589.1 hypothetical protein TWF103_007107 [Orbilia oligospora]KAF3125637.1 hypothetical protein TWF569_000745 [Orbilia oligospora]KAF3132431.1 hypothetical protein TWF594_009560 [Orbilia oligospora]
MKRKQRKAARIRYFQFCQSSYRQDLSLEKEKKEKGAGRTDFFRPKYRLRMNDDSFPARKRETRMASVHMYGYLLSMYGFSGKTLLHKVTVWNKLVWSVRMAHLVRVWFWEPLHTTSPPASLYLIQPAGAA